MEFTKFKELEMKYQRGFIGGLLLVVFVGLCALIIFSLVFELYKSATSRYWIYSGDGVSSYTNSYEIKGGCVYFSDEFNNNIEQCGQYKIEDHEN